MSKGLKALLSYRSRKWSHLKIIAAINVLYSFSWKKKPQKKGMNRFLHAKHPHCTCEVFFHQKASCKAFALPALIQCDITHEIFCLSFCCRQKKSRGISVCVCAIRSAKHPSNICMCLHFWHVVWLFSGPFVWSPTTKLSSYIFLTLQFYGTFCKITTSASAVVNTVTTKIITDQNLQISKNMQNLPD